MREAAVPGIKAPSTARGIAGRCSGQAHLGARSLDNGRAPAWAEQLWRKLASGHSSLSLLTTRHLAAEAGEELDRTQWADAVAWSCPRGCEAAGLGALMGDAGCADARAVGERRRPQQAPARQQAGDRGVVHRRVSAVEGAHGQRRAAAQPMPIVQLAQWGVKRIGQGEAARSLKTPWNHGTMRTVLTVTAAWLGAAPGSTAARR